MTDSKEAPKGTIVTLSMHKDDVEKLMQAFREGKLAHLGITEIAIPDEAEQQKIRKEWADTHSKRPRHKRGGSSRDLP